MNTAGKFIALAFQAYANKQFEDAGALFAQAAECSDVTKLTNALLQPVTSDVPDTQKPILNDNLQQLSSEEDETSGDEWGDEEDSEQEDTKADGEDEATEGEGEEPAEDDGDTQDESESADLESQSSGAVHAPARRKVTSMYQIGKILAAAMEATSSEDDAPEETSDSESEDDEDTDIMPEPDPDLPGEELVPVALSCVTLKGFVVNSPVKLKQ